MRIVDLSLPLDNNSRWAPWWARTHVKRQSHRASALLIRLFFRLSPTFLRNGLGWANDEIRLSTHGTTHLDAPWHFGPTCEGQPAKTIDQVPLEWCYGPGVVLDLRHAQGREAITVQDLQTALAAIGHALSPGEIVLIRTSGDRRWGTRAYFTDGVGVSAEATRWLIDQGIKVMGIDAWGWDGPIERNARRAKASGKTDAFWAAHYVGIEREYGHLERLANLDALPPTGFTVCCFPLKVAGGSAGPARVVALLDR